MTKIKHAGRSGARLIPGIGYVEPGAVVEVDAEQAESLIASGHFEKATAPPKKAEPKQKETD